jgi:hypothetical protein
MKVRRRRWSYGDTLLNSQFRRYAEGADKRAGAAAGVDSIKAIVLALQMIGVELYCSDHHKPGGLIWMESSRGYGVPVAANVRELLWAMIQTLSRTNALVG